MQTFYNNCANIKTHDNASTTVSESMTIQQAIY